MLGTAGVLFPEILKNLGTGGPAAQQVNFHRLSAFTPLCESSAGILSFSPRHC